KKESDLAIIEHYRGQIMQLQNDHQTAIKHLQNAYELDPTDYRKKKYEEALTLAEEDNVQEDS
ncbi:MAG: tetratricopeptide repeat protein, partial [Planctomycetota bacterium]